MGRKLKKDNPKRYSLVLAVLLISSLTGMMALLISALKIQVFEHSKWLERYDAQVFASSKDPSSRRDIVDRYGRPLAVTVMQPSVFADPAFVSDPDETARIVSSVLGLKSEKIRKKLKAKKRFLWIRRNISDLQARALIARKLPGIYVVYEHRRFYPMRSLAGQLIGFVGTDGHGLEGIEKEFDSLMIIKGNKKRFVRDALGRQVVEEEVPSTETNEPLKLTIDSYIQRVAEAATEKIAQKYNPESAQVVIIDPRTFEILAVVNWPFFDPNAFHAYPPEIRRNRAFLDLFEPGSSVKPILVAGALEENLASTNDIVFCENGSFHVPGHTIKDVHPYGWLTLTQVVKYSSNIGAAKLAFQLGAEKYYQYLLKFGFGQPTGVEFPGEAAGIIRDWKLWRPLDLATSAFGQGIAVTALQLCSAFATIANGGIKKTPYLLKSGHNHADEKALRVISSQTSRILTTMLIEVTLEGGTGARASVPGYRVAGKTGTAQRIDPSTGKYSDKQFSSIFVGFAPAEDPRITVAVVVHSPQGASYGGIVAAPVFREIVANVLPYLGIPAKNEAVQASDIQVRYKHDRKT
ncbi:peptidoglycan D,D-transpeptidase FtsI family protein [Thermodesulforhabdus norvegica]|uniref:Cell division protein FtsI (Penicillin-binding protein 3) n=1 Tax=Thermodesulforhabdus norvegica TaxID=39841 RepID=A0A1I4VGI2_9BACT|nr:penicillin-binding protein 2 [Thermodesulforhabdus norvegica]SFN00307.1 cell division protein FtsI (penicillin-binding protein 3) [Thermodesulforhabdus norvegica]